MKNFEYLLSETLRNNPAYTPQAYSEDTSKLDAMESPFAWPEEALSEFFESAKNLAFRLYPDAGHSLLKTNLHKLLGTDEKELGLIFGNGSDELILLMLQAMLPQRHLVMSVSPSFVIYKQFAQFLGLPFFEVPLAADFSLPLENLLKAIHSQQPKLLFLAQPNNPTGHLASKEELHAILEAMPGFVVMDEAYFPFASDTCLPWMKSKKWGQKLLLMRTFSKLGTAGLRCGFLLAEDSLSQQLNKLRLPYNLNCMTQLAMQVYLKHYAKFAAQAQEICSLRQELAQSLAQVQGLEVFPSQTNFLLVRYQQELPDLFASLLEEKILVKNLATSHPLLQRCIRITIGTMSQNQQVLQSLQGISQKVYGAS